MKSFKVAEEDECEVISGELEDDISRRHDEYLEATKVFRLNEDQTGFLQLVRRNVRKRSLKTNK